MSGLSEMTAREPWLDATGTIPVEEVHKVE